MSAEKQTVKSVADQQQEPLQNQFNKYHIPQKHYLTLYNTHIGTQPWSAARGVIETLTRPFRQHTRIAMLSNPCSQLIPFAHMISN